MDRYLPADRPLPVDFAEKILETAGRIVGKGKSRAYARTKERLAHGVKEAERLFKEGLLTA